MSKFFIKILLFLFILTNQSMSEENLMILKLKDGDVKIELFPDVAPNHVKRIKELADSGKYDNVVFHRVIDGFMAQTGVAFFLCFLPSLSAFCLLLVRQVFIYPSVIWQQ